LTAVPTGDGPVYDGPLTRAALARKYRVHRSTVTRALQAAAEDHAADASHPQPPSPKNSGGSPELFDQAEFDTFWPTRRRPGRGGGRSPKETT
jgi:hypothetical protein